MSVDIARERAIAWAREVAQDERTVFLDTETTGLDGSAEIIDFAVVDLSGRVVIDTLIRPRRPIPAQASAIHGLFDHHVAGAPDWLQMYDDVVSALHGRRVIVYNASYDRRMIQQSCDAHVLDAPNCAWECAMRRYAEFAGRRSNWGKGYRQHKLDRAAAAFRIPPGGHRARADADVCRQVVLGMAASRPRGDAGVLDRPGLPNQ